MSTERKPPPSRAVVVGREEVVAPFRAAGLESVTADPTNAADRVKALVANGYAVIFYTADLTDSLVALIQHYSSLPEPSLVELPSGHLGSGGPGRLREIVRRAAGVDVFGEASPARLGGAQ
ncbi:MAG: V-type ATP synthase subunit F [candidate division WOR-3 bacterium]